MFNKSYTVEKDNYLTAGSVSSSVKSFLKELGVESDKLRKISVACYEAEINMIIHSNGGEIIMNILEDKIQLLFNDTGPGIPDLEKAMTPGWSTANEKAREFGFGAGMGLVNIKRVSDSFDIESSPEGTKLKIEFNL